MRLRSVSTSPRIALKRSQLFTGYHPLGRIWLVSELLWWEGIDRRCVALESESQEEVAEEKMEEDWLTRCHGTCIACFWALRAFSILGGAKRLKTPAINLLLVSRDPVGYEKILGGALAWLFYKS